MVIKSCDKCKNQIPPGISYVHTPSTQFSPSSLDGHHHVECWVKMVEENKKNNGVRSA